MVEAGTNIVKEFYLNELVEKILKHDSKSIAM